MPRTNLTPANVDPAKVPSISIWDRPTASAIDLKPSFTDEQINARKAFVKALTELLAPEKLASLGAFVTPGREKKNDKTGETHTPLMVALSVMVPGLTFKAEGDDNLSVTRDFNLSINAILPAPSDTQSADGSPVPEMKALTFAELRAKQIKRK